MDAKRLTDAEIAEWSDLLAKWCSDDFSVKDLFAAMQKAIPELRERRAAENQRRGQFSAAPRHGESGGDDDPNYK